MNATTTAIPARKRQAGHAPRVQPTCRQTINFLQLSEGDLRNHLGRNLPHEVFLLLSLTSQ